MGTARLSFWANVLSAATLFELVLPTSQKEITVIGNEFLRLDENGLIERFEVAWRPLASAALIQEKLANQLGGQPMRLVPA